MASRKRRPWLEWKQCPTRGVELFARRDEETLRLDP